MTKISRTALVRDVDEVPGTAHPLTAPVYETTTFVFESAAEGVAYTEGRSTAYLYSRYANPTTAAVERAIARLDDADGALLFGSGQAASTAVLMAHLQAGDEVVCPSAIYGGTFHLLVGVLARFGVRTRFVPLEALQTPSAWLGPSTRMLWCESPVNPTLRCVDLAAVAAGCRAHGVRAVIDNTFATPVNQQPLAVGFDVVVQSATKYLNGHSDVTAGVVTASHAMLAPIEQVRRLTGGVLDPRASAALGRGLKTLTLRVAQQNATALAVAQALQDDPRVVRVWYPGLPDHPDHALASRQMSGFGGMVCLDLGDDLSRAARCYDRLRVFRRATSLGGVESLASLPVLTSHAAHSPEELAAAGISRGMVRLSIGLEEADDLIADLRQALD